MKLKLIKTFTAGSAFMLTLLGIASARAGTISVTDLPATGTDAATPINSANTYLDAFDFGNGTAISSINGVDFTHFTLAANNVSATTNVTDLNFGGTLTLTASGPYSGANELGQANNTGVNNQANGNTRALLNSMIYVTGGAGKSIGADLELDFGGLTAGDSYALDIYYRQWTYGSDNPTRSVDISFDGEGTSQAYSGNPLDEDSGGAQYIEYDFTAASSDVTCTMTDLNDNESPMIYGATLQVTAVPEPSAAGVFAVGGLLLGLGCWRRAVKKRTSNA
jgi:hypothetical protein